VRSVADFGHLGPKSFDVGTWQGLERQQQKQYAGVFLMSVELLVCRITVVDVLMSAMRRELVSRKAILRSIRGPESKGDVMQTAT
jgi:hypothetical protein